ncbi:metal-sensing transcriptional repressor [Candidatus Gottesmanbacteria bacterium]|nr:metal-sensing transcriptional repressor [Candidatus Gottesmanbacteria bacterium]
MNHQHHNHNHNHKEHINNQSIVTRLKITEGHLKKIREMVEENAYCIDILHQTQAVEAALKEINSLLLNNHLNTCVVDSIKKGDSKEVISEVMAVFKRSQKNG